MNSTGKDLSTADLVRNFVLMGLPMDEQEDLYANYWRKIEETLGADSYDEVFDEFLRNWLSVIYAPTSINMRDVYRLFKRHVMDNGYDKPGQMAVLLKEIRRYAGHYTCITAGAYENKELHVLLARIRAFDVSVVNLLLMSFFGTISARLFHTMTPLSCLRSTESKPCRVLRSQGLRGDPSGRGEDGRHISSDVGFGGRTACSRERVSACSSSLGRAGMQRIR